MRASIFTSKIKLGLGEGGAILYPGAFRGKASNHRGPPTCARDVLKRRNFLKSNWMTCIISDGEVISPFLGKAHRYIDRDSRNLRTL